MVKALLKFIRLPNLIIVALTQYLLLYGLLVPFLEQESIGRSLDNFHFLLFVIDTVLITLSGNIINDIVDYPIDKRNRPDTVFVSQFISVKNAYILYTIVVLLGFVIAFYLADYINQLGLLIIYPIAVLSLYLYSTYFKKRILIGNLIVSLFCAGVAFFVLFAERNAYFLLEIDIQKQVYQVFFAYTLFAFLTTLYREIIKDIEDKEGDEKEGCKTLPIVMGQKTAKNTALTTLGIFILFMIYMIYNLIINNYHFILIAYTLLFIFIPSLYLLLKTIKANENTHFHHISQITKLLMLSGLIMVPIYYYTF